MNKVKNGKQRKQPQQPERIDRASVQENGKKIIGLVAGGCAALCILLIVILCVVAYVLYQRGQRERLDAPHTMVTRTEEGTGESAEIFAIETEYIYMEVPLPSYMSGKDSGLYVTLSSNDGSITLYVSGECVGCTVIPPDDISFAQKYTTVIEEIFMSGQTCKRTAYMLKDAGTYELYEVSCTKGEEEAHVGGECKGGWSKVIECDRMVKGMVVENI